MAAVQQGRRGDRAGDPARAARRGARRRARQPARRGAGAPRARLTGTGRWTASASPTATTRRDPRAGPARPRAPRPLHRPRACSRSSRSTSSPTPGTTSATTASCRTRATTSRTEIGGQPLIVVRHGDGIGARADEPLRAQGLAPGERAVAATPASSSAARTTPGPTSTDGIAAHHAAEERLRGHGAARVRIGQGPGDGAARARLPRLHLRQAQRRRPRLRGVLRRLADRRSTTWPTARPKASSRSPAACLRFLHQCNWKMFVENLNDTMHPMVVHESSAGTAKRMWLGKPADAAQADGDRAVRAVHVRLRVLRGHGRARLRQRAQLLRRALLDPQQVLGGAGATRSDGGGLRRASARRRSSAWRATTRSTTRT